jgi:hypothetical protein
MERTQADSPLTAKLVVTALLKLISPLPAKEDPDIKTLYLVVF